MRASNAAWLQREIILIHFESLATRKNDYECQYYQNPTRFRRGSMADLPPAHTPRVILNDLPHT